MFQVVQLHLLTGRLSPRIKYEKSYSYSISFSLALEVKFVPGCCEDFVLVDNHRDDGGENVTQRVNSRNFKLVCPSLCQMLATFSGVEF